MLVRTYVVNTGDLFIMKTDDTYFMYERDDLSEGNDFTEGDDSNAGNGEDIPLAGD